MGNRLVTAHAEKVGSKNNIKHFHSTSTYKHIKATIASVLMWLSMVGGLL